MNARAITQARTFRSLREHRNYRLWFGGQIVSVTGTWVQSVAQAWFIAALTHSALALGLLAACQFGPYAIFGLFGGAISDRLDNRHTLMGTQAAFMASALLITVLALAGVAEAWHIYVLAIFNGFVQILDTPARQAFTVEMVGRDELPNAVALNSSIFNASRIVGPALGGVLIATLGVGICFLINAISFLAVLGALAAMHSADLRKPTRQAHRSLLRDTGEGIAYAWRTPTIRLVTGMMLVVGTMSMNFNVLLPILAQRTLHSGPEVFGWISAAFGAGALLGALTAATIGRSSRTVLLAGSALFGLTQLALGPLTSTELCMLMLFLNGIAFSLYTAMSNSTIQLIVPDRLRGRMMAIYGYVFFGTAPVGGLIAGALAAAGGTELAFAVAGGTAVVVAALGTVHYHVGKRRRRVVPVASLGADTTLVRQ